MRTITCVLGAIAGFFTFVGIGLTTKDFQKKIKNHEPNWYKKQTVFLP